MGKLGKEEKRLYYLVRCLAEAGFSLRGGDLKGDNLKRD